MENARIRRIAAWAGLSAALVAVGCSSKNSQVSPTARWFVQKGCTSCHAIDALGVSGRVSGAPDLSLAVVDVPRRYGMSVEQFLAAPPGGTMSIVLSSQIRLSASERALAVRGLQEALEAHRRTRPGPESR